MKFKLIALDLDETLLNSERKISPRNRAAIQRAREMGIIVTFNTGRMFPSAQPYAVDLGLDAPLITYQGAMIKTAAGEALYHQTIPLPIARSVIQAGEHIGLQAFVYCQDQLIVSKITPEVTTYLAMYHVSAQAVGNLGDFLRDEPTKVLLFSPDESLREPLWPEMVRQFHNDLHITQSKPCYFEFTHPAATKGIGLNWLSAHLGIAREEILAFGDSFNDLDFFRNAGYAVAMGNAWEEIKALADMVTATNDQDGVAKAIEALVLSASDDQAAVI